VRGPAPLERPVTASRASVMVLSAACHRSATTPTGSCASSPPRARGRVLCPRAPSSRACSRTIARLSPLHRGGGRNSFSTRSRGVLTGAHGLTCGDQDGQHPGDLVTARSSRGTRRSSLGITVGHDHIRDGARRCDPASAPGDRSRDTGRTTDLALLRKPVQERRNVDAAQPSDRAAPLGDHDLIAVLHPADPRPSPHPYARCDRAVRGYRHCLHRTAIRRCVAWRRSECWRRLW
jgi:hypothetical protein